MQHGMASCANWLQWRCGTNPGAAREKVRVARALPGLPQISEAFSEGRVSYSKVRAMTRVATRENESCFLNIARYGTARQLEQVVRNYRMCGRLKLLSEAREAHALRELSWLIDEDGCWVLNGHFTPEQGAVIRQALEKAMDALFDERQDEHPDVSAETPRRMACDAAVVRWHEDENGEPLSIGRKSRTIPPAIRRALQKRDGGCRFPGCSCCRFVDAHHIVHWADGGETAMDNLVLLCRRHHRLVHEGGFGVRRGAGNEIWFSYPGGATLPATADGRFRGNARRVFSLSEAKVLQITPRTLPADCGGEIDYNYAQGLLEQYDSSNG